MNCCKIRQKKIGLSPLYELFTKGDRKIRSRQQQQNGGRRKKCRICAVDLYFGEKQIEVCCICILFYHINILGELPLKNCLQHEQQ